MSLMIPIYVLIFSSCVAVANSDPISSTTLKADLLDEGRIIGGDIVIEGDLRYQLSLRYRKFHHCGASLIAVEDTLLAITAAHCTENFEPDQFSLVAGDVRFSDKTGREQERNVVKIVNHENYDPETISYDIGLLFLDQPFTLTNWVSPIPLPEQDQETKGTLIVSGWGVYNFQGFYSDNLTKLEVPVVDDELCKDAYAPLQYEYFEHFLCAGYYGIGVFKDSCKGDSGGPLRSKEEGYLAGIVSWSEGCAHPRFPGVNTEVSHFIDWIQEEVSKHTSGKKRERDQPASDLEAKKPKKSKRPPMSNNGTQVNPTA